MATERAVAIRLSSEASDGPLAELARRLDLPVVTGAADAGDWAFELCMRDGRVSLVGVSGDGPGPLSVDFVRGAARRARGLVGGQPLVLACGWRKGCRTVLDATAGLGGDAIQLAAVGFEVTACERNAIMMALLDDGLCRARECGLRSIMETASRVRTLASDARDVLEGDQQFDTVYIDPMYAGRRKGAVKKEMAVCRAVVGDDIDARDLADRAMGRALRRVVIKRHPHASPMLPSPTHAHRGKLVRYDVYAIDRGAEAG